MPPIFDRDGLKLKDTTGSMGSPALLAEMPFNPEAAPVALLETTDILELWEALGVWLVDTGAVKP